MEMAPCLTGKTPALLGNSRNLGWSLQEIGLLDSRMLASVLELVARRPSFMYWLVAAGAQFGHGPHGSSGWSVSALPHPAPRPESASAGGHAAPARRGRIGPRLCAGIKPAGLSNHGKTVGHPRQSRAYEFAALTWRASTWSCRFGRMRSPYAQNPL